MPLTNQLDIARFWSKVKVGPETNCWPWQGTVTVNGGYGQFSFDGTNARAHRLAAMFFGADLQPGQIVLHTCDNPPCCNPMHLVVGTHTDNMRDKVAKGRHVWASGRAKLQPDQVLEIRRRLADGEDRRSLATEFGVHPSTIHHIGTRRYWPNL